MESSRNRPPVEPAEWDDMYGGADQLWSGNPNETLVTETAALLPGSAVDVGCGEGADGIWLAQKGWRVTAFDVSETALQRASVNANGASVSLEFLRGGLLDVILPVPQFDLVNVQYPALLHEGGRSLARLLELVAPGGTLLFVHHAGADSDEARRAGFDLSDYVLPKDAQAALGEGWDVQVFEERPRHVATGAGAAHDLDLVLKAQRVA